MDQTDFFFNIAVDLKHHGFSKQHENAMYAVYKACKAIREPRRYGDSIHSIAATVILQDYDSKFHRPYVRYNPDSKEVEAKVKVDWEQVLKSGLRETAAIYEAAIVQVLEEVKEEAPDFDFDKLKRDLHKAIQEEIGMVE